MLTDQKVRGTLAGLMRNISAQVLADGGSMFEGGSSVPEVLYLHDLVERFGLQTVAEIGFNVGHSAFAFLEASPDLELVSFELDERRCVKLAKNFVDERYPGRHQLKVGSSLTTVPAHAAESQQRFDLVFVDGGHEYETAIDDIRNSRMIAKPGGLVVVDDMTPWLPWGSGPYKAWSEAVDTGLIEPIEYYVDGFELEQIEGPGDRAWALGRFAS